MPYLAFISSGAILGAFSASFVGSDRPRFGIRRSGFAAFRRDLTRLTPIPNVFRRYRTSSFRSRRLHARRALGTWPRRHSRRRPAVTRETRSFDVVVPHRYLAESTSPLLASTRSWCLLGIVCRIRPAELPNQKGTSAQVCTSAVHPRTWYHRVLR